MTKKQKQQVIRLLKKDCQVSEKYVCGNRTCAIGCLALAAGVKRERLKKSNSSCIDVLQDVARAIEKKFGLDLFQLVRIQTANDRGETTKVRRQFVLDYVEDLDAY